jgi:hypothetical protein
MKNDFYHVGYDNVYCAGKLVFGFISCIVEMLYGPQQTWPLRTALLRLMLPFDIVRLEDIDTSNRTLGAQARANPWLTRLYQPIC